MKSTKVLLFKLLSNSLFWYLQWLINSLCLITECHQKILLSGTFCQTQKTNTNLCFPINYFHYRPFNTVTSFNDHFYFYNSVFSACCLWLKYFLWSPKLSLKVVAASPKYTFFHRWLHFQHLLYILNLGSGIDSEEDKYFSLYSYHHIWWFWVGVMTYYAFYYWWYIAHGNVTDFYFIFIESLVQLVLFRKIFL